MQRWLSLKLVFHVWLAVSTLAWAQTCPLPTLPEVTAAVEVAVGDGTAASCTQAALQAALDTPADQGTVRVTFNCGAAPHTIALTGQLTLERGGTNNVLTILDAPVDAAGAPLITLDGQGNTRILRAGQRADVLVRNIRFVNGATSGSNLEASGAALSAGLRARTYVQNSIFENNHALGNSEVGGALYSRGGQGALTVVTDSQFRNNRGNIGGAINNLLTDLYVVDSTFESNRAEGDIAYGGAIYTDGGASDGGANLGQNNGVVSICQSRFEDNEARGQGGAAFLFVYGNQQQNQTDRIEVRSSLFRNNRITGTGSDGFDGLGGGLRSGNGTTLIEDSSFIGNRAGQQGGGLWLGENANYPTTIRNVTFYENRAQRETNGNGGLAGAAFLGNGDVTLTNVTVASNYAGFQGGAFWGGSGATLRNSIVANNIANNDGNNWDIQHNCPVQMQGSNNLEFPDINANSNQSVTCTAGITIADPQLGTLSGDVPALTLLETSPAIDAAANCPAEDQLGQTRVGTCDIGAFEFQGNVALTISGIPEPTVSVGSSYSFVPTVTPDTGTLTFSITNEPTWATFDTSTGELSGTPSEVSVTTGIEISVSDGTNSASLVPFDITVAEVSGTLTFSVGAASPETTDPVAGADNVPVLQLVVAASGGTATLTTLSFALDSDGDLASINLASINLASIEAIKLFQDLNANGQVDDGEPQLASVGIVSIDTFTSPFTLTLENPLELPADTSETLLVVYDLAE